MRMRKTLRCTWVMANLTLRATTMTDLFEVWFRKLCQTRQESLRAVSHSYLAQQALSLRPTRSPMPRSGRWEVPATGLYPGGIQAYKVCLAGDSRGANLSSHHRTTPNSNLEKLSGRSSKRRPCRLVNKTTWQGARKKTAAKELATADQDFMAYKEHGISVDSLAKFDGALLPLWITFVKLI